ncbi:MAG: tRNA lysidine(34) synthetase TilS [SAR86 cluster bacterium]|jgi:tRNA(Ile)-lysidine synthase|nr:MAG: tRNA lysidine(34) synthetase TilS [SAR86 cluster bacterium]
MTFIYEEDKSLILNASRIYVSYSGGADSTYALVKMREYLDSVKLTSKLTALHFNHGNKQSGAFESHCNDFCNELNINFESQNIKVEVSGEGFEAAARLKRMNILKSLAENSLIIQGHHSDDQIETVLFRIIRGTGLKGISGIPRVAKVGENKILRPFLKETKENILEFLSKNKINFIEDHTNNDISYSRNFLRKEVIPRIKDKWHSINENVSKMTEITKDQNSLYEHYLKDKIDDLKDDGGLTIEGLKKLDTFERSEVIRLWLDMELVTTPNHSQMKEIEKSFFQSRQDANPVIKFERSDRQRVGVILKKINKTLVMEKFDE